MLHSIYIFTEKLVSSNALNNTALNMPRNRSFLVRESLHLFLKCNLNIISDIVQIPQHNICTLTSN